MLVILNPSTAAPTEEIVTLPQQAFEEVNGSSQKHYVEIKGAGVVAKLTPENLNLLNTCHPEPGCP